MPNNVGTYRTTAGLTVDNDLIWDETRWENGPDRLITNPTSELDIAGIYAPHNGYVAKMSYAFDIPEEYRPRVYAWNIEKGELLCHGLPRDVNPAAPSHVPTVVFFVGHISVFKELAQ